MRDALFQQFATVIHQQFGIQLPMDKKALLESRLFKLLNNNVGKPEYANEEAFLRYVQNDVTGKALAQLSEVITTHHTFFMREQDHFQFFGDTYCLNWKIISRMAMSGHGVRLVPAVRNHILWLCSCMISLVSEVLAGSILFWLRTYPEKYWRQQSREFILLNQWLHCHHAGRVRISRNVMPSIFR